MTIIQKIAQCALVTQVFACLVLIVKEPAKDNATSH